jgi:hypothetical protein
MLYAGTSYAVSNYCNARSIDRIHSVSTLVIRLQTARDVGVGDFLKKTYKQCDIFTKAIYADRNVIV